MRDKWPTVVIALLILVLHLSVSRAETIRVKRVIDGDTLLLTNGEKGRLIGISEAGIGNRKWQIVTNR